MADYYPLITRAVEALSENTPDLRQAVYDRARDALMQQLRSLDPPLSEADISRERRSLDLAIDRVERQFAGASERAGSSPASAGFRPPRPAPVPAPRPAPAATPRASSLAPRPRDPAPVSAREDWRSAAAAPVPPEQEAPPPPVIEPGPPPGLRGSLDEGEATEMAVPSENGRERPRVRTVAPALGQGGQGRSIILAVVLGVVISLIALTAWLLRDRPAEAPRPPVVAQAPSAPEPDNKFGERVGADRPQPTPTPAPAPAAPASPQAAAPAPGAPTPAARPDLGIAQRAILYEENPADPQTPRATPARVLWKLDAVNAGQGQPLETVVRASIETSDGAFVLNLLLRRNLDAALPASHTIELAFKSTSNDPNRVVRDVGKLALKNEEGQPGAPLAGLQVPVTTNLFLFGLSNVPRDIERNTELLLRRNWIDLPIMFASGQRAVLSFEKGRPGESVISEAFRQW